MEIKKEGEKRILETAKEIKKEVKREVKKETEKQVEKIIQMSKISLALDRYGDIFSDFDPRDYSKRALSQDFLEEAQRASKDKEDGKIELNLLIPPLIRKEDQEPAIKKRLREHFKNHYEELKREAKKIIRRGVYFIIFGIILMFAATYVLFAHAEASLLTSFLVVFLEPAGWFFFWEGLGQIIFETKKMNPKLQFYKKMSKCEVTFISDFA